MDFEIRKTFQPNYERCNNVHIVFAELLNGAISVLKNGLSTKLKSTILKDIAADNLDDDVMVGFGTEQVNDSIKTDVLSASSFSQ